MCGVSASLASESSSLRRLSLPFDGQSVASYRRPMGHRFALSAALAAFIPFISPAAAVQNVGTPGDPVTPGVPPPFFRKGGPESFPRLPGANEGIPYDGPVSGQDAPPGHPSAPRPGDADAAPSPKPPTRAEKLDRLLDRLGKAADAEEAQGIAGLVQRMWMESGSDTADLLMSRAVSAMSGDRHDVAEALLDQIIALQPGWAEAWNKRATLRFLEHDDAGSMEDISHVLALEPRHFGALSGMGFILERHGEEAGALKALRRALAVYPQDADVRKAVDKLAPTVEGQDL